MENVFMTQDQVLAKIKSDLNNLVIELGLVDEEGVPLYSFYGEVSNYDDYDWIKSLATITSEGRLRYVPIIPFVLIRTSSVPSSGEKIQERIEEYSMYFFIKSGTEEDIRLIFETYMGRENYENNPERTAGGTIFKKFFNYEIGQEELSGAPDGLGRHQVDVNFSYDFFESNLVASNDYELFINGEKVKYLSWRLEKGNMIIANSPNILGGKDIINVDKLHEISLVTELYLDRTNESVVKVYEDLLSLTKTNALYEIEIRLGGVQHFKANMIISGGRMSDIPPQIDTIIPTFSLSYKKLGLSIGIAGNVVNGEQVFEDIPVYDYKFGHAAAMYTSAYFGNNASKSTKVGAAKAFAFVIPVLVSDSEVTTRLIEEILEQDYVTIYTIKLTYLGVVRIYNVVLDTSGVEGSDAAYDNFKLVFLEAK